MSLELILSRRSIRKYTAVPVMERDVDDLLRAAMAAPSAGNQQPWHFIVITERELLEAISGFHPYAGMTAEAPLAILACGEPALEKHPGNWMLDLSAAVENLLLAAHAKGLGAVWVGIYPVEERMRPMRELLGVPSHVVSFALIPVGHPAESKPPSGRFNVHRIHRNRW
jgi:nitroreductase